MLAVCITAVSAPTQSTSDCTAVPSSKGLTLLQDQLKVLYGVLAYGATLPFPVLTYECLPADASHQWKKTGR